MKLSDYSLPKNVDVGLAFEARLGCVPEYECREVAVFSGYSWGMWQEADYFDRACAVAHYRIHHLIDAHVHDAVNREAKRKANIAKARGRGK